MALARNAVFQHEERWFSQNGEDGVLEWLTQSVASRRVVEIAAGNGTECQAANLILRHGWEAVLVDIDAQSIRAAQVLYERYPVDCFCEKVTRDNINDIATGNIGVFSLDVDGNDYWLWHALEARPEIVCAEYNARFGPDRAVTIPYDPDFRFRQNGKPRYYHGASLLALERLAHRRGYRLVGCESSGTNAFFVREDRAHGLPGLTARQAYIPPRKPMKPIEYDLIEVAA